MFERNGHKLGSVIREDSEPSEAETPKPSAKKAAAKKTATKKAAAKKAAPAKKAASSEPSPHVGREGSDGGDDQN